jgi:hypothetical protein
VNVTPVKAGVQWLWGQRYASWIPAFAGMKKPKKMGAVSSTIFEFNAYTERLALCPPDLFIGRPAAPHAASRNARGLL